MQNRLNNHRDDYSGDWQGLDTQGQSVRYDTIAEMLRQSGSDGNVLDVGCGEGILRTRLPKGGIYLGIEPSVAAFRIASTMNPTATFINIDAERFVSRKTLFRGIVFNEMLYYSADPIGLLRKFAPLLLPGGVILCSIYQREGFVSIKARLRCLLDRRRPVSNIHCEKMLRKFMAEREWSILDDRKVGVSGCNGPWHIWSARPQ